MHILSHSHTNTYIHTISYKDQGGLSLAPPILDLHCEGALTILSEVIQDKLNHSRGNIMTHLVGLQGQTQTQKIMSNPVQNPIRKHKNKKTLH